MHDSGRIVGCSEVETPAWSQILNLRFARHPGTLRRHVQGFDTLLRECESLSVMPEFTFVRFQVECLNTAKESMLL